MILVMPKEFRGGCSWGLGAGLAVRIGLEQATVKEPMTVSLGP